MSTSHSFGKPLLLQHLVLIGKFVCFLFWRLYAPTLCIRNLLDGSKHNVSTRRNRSLSRIYSKPNTEVIFHCIVILYGTSLLINHGVQLSYTMTKGGYSSRCDFFGKCIDQYCLY